MVAMADILARARPVLPVLVIDQPAQAVPLARALLQGGLDVLEVTLRTAQALEAIRLIRHALPEVVVGAGTICTAEQLRQAQQAGAQFAVSPGFSAQLAQAAQEQGLPWLPGVMTPSDVLQAQEWGCRQLKLFPAGGVRGLELLDSLAGPFPDVHFCPTGGINSANLSDFLQRPNVICCGGSWLAPQALVAAQNWVAISELAQQARVLPNHGVVPA